MSSRVFHFSGASFAALEWCDPHRDATLVADSWRVEQGQAVALWRHQARFTHSALVCGLERSIVDAFWSAVQEIIPSTGSWFPRVSVVSTPGGPSLRYLERPAPPWASSVALATGASDPRTSPLTKGPDLEALMSLRRSVAEVGADEAVIVSPEGAIIEGAYSTVMAWLPGSSELTSVGPGWPRIPSVTEAVIADLVTQRRIRVSSRTLRPVDLEGAEIWILSALHGIRVASHWVGGPGLFAQPGRRTLWQDAWWGSRLPILDCAL